MSRTTEQKAADEALEDAILACRAAYGGESEDPEMLGSWVVVTAAIRVDREGQAEHVYDVLMRAGGIPDHELVGLLEIGRIMYERGKMSAEEGQ